MDRTRGLSVLTFIIGVIFIFNYALFEITGRLDYTLSSNTTFKICPIFSGRLGNHMFIYASSYAIALSKGMKVEIEYNSELLSIFKLTADIIGNNSDCRLNKVREIGEGKAAAFNKKIMDFCPTSSVRLRHFLQSHIYFNDYKVEVRNQFTFRDDIKTKAINILKNITKKYKAILKNTKNATFIGVHIRRGDRVELSKGGLKSGGFRVASKEYLHRAVDWYEQRYKNIIFVVASNGIDWAKENMPKNRKVAFLVKNTPEVDMAILSMCNHTIMTFGTFSWWAGWLAGGNVTYFRWPAIEKGWFRTQYSTHWMDHYYPHWIGIDG